MSDTASSPIHVSFSDEKKEELLVQQPSASSVVRDDSQSQHNAEESPLQVYEIPGSPRQADELNEQPQQSAAKKQSENHLRSGYGKPASSFEAISSGCEAVFQPEHQSGKWEGCHINVYF